MKFEAAFVAQPLTVPPAARGSTRSPWCRWRDRSAATSSSAWASPLANAEHGDRPFAAGRGGAAGDAPAFCEVSSACPIRHRRRVLVVAPGAYRYAR